MHFGKFALYTTLGAGVWNCVLASLGYWLSTQFPEEQLLQQLEHYNKYLSYGGYALAIIIVLFIAYHALKKGEIGAGQQAK